MTDINRSNEGSSMSKMLSVYINDEIIDPPDKMQHANYTVATGFEE